MSRRAVPLAASALVAALAIAPNAFARAGDRSFATTYPAASALCARAADGTLGGRLEAQRTQVQAACDTLQNAFGPLVSAVDAAESTYLGVVSTQNGLVATACAKPVSNQADCETARATRHTAIAAAYSTEQTALTTFRTAVENNRATFWSTIDRLRGVTPPSTGSTGATA